MQSRGKDRSTAGILAILLGSIGVHHFYLGSNTAGVVEIVACCGLGGLVGIVEGVMLLIMDQNEFDQRYNYRTPEPMEFVFMKPKTMTPPAPPSPPYQG
jgi:TM2 domain-containing membrane protein YozV